MTDEKKYVLSNGVRVLIEEIPYVHSASIGLWVDVGARSEEGEVNGISHFIEHMMFKGTARRSALEIAQELEVSGGSLNAFTDKENTCYYARVLAEELPTAIDVLSDMLLNSAMDPAEIRREKRVVLEEIKMYEDSPDELVHDLLSTAIWAGHPLGMPIIGTRKTVRGLNRDRVMQHLDRFYTPERLVVSIAGKLDVEKTLHQLEATLGAFKRSQPTPLEATPPPTRAATVVKYRDIEQCHLCIGMPGVAVDDPARFPLAVLDNILGGGMSSRLFQEVREKRGLVYSIHSYEALYRAGGIFAIYAGFSPKHLKEVIRVVGEELDRIKAGEVTEEELARAKQQLKGSLLLSLEVPRHRMSRMARNELYYGRSIPAEEIVAEIEAVDAAALQRIGGVIFDPSRTTTSIVGPLRRMPSGVSLVAS